MNNIKEFRTLIDASMSEALFKDLAKRQESGEIRSAAEFREELFNQLTTLSKRGKITLEIPIKPYDIVTAEQIREFFDSLKLDIEILFKEVDHTETVLTGLVTVIRGQLQSLKFSVGQLKAEAVQRKITIEPGSGFSRISRDGFDRGYSKLAGRSDTPYNIFRDIRNAEDALESESVVIKADAKIDDIGKKLTLPESNISEVGFKEVSLGAGDVSDIPITQRYDIKNSIDPSDDTFWSYTIAKAHPILGTAYSRTNQISGPAGVAPTINLSGLVNNYRQDFYLKITKVSGSTANYVAGTSLNQAVGPTCIYDIGKCQWDYKDFYSDGCTNTICSRYTFDDHQMVSGVGNILDGFGFDTGIDFAFNSGMVSGLIPGQTWQISVLQSGTVGATVVLELDLKLPNYINWLELIPVAGQAFNITKVQYSKPLNSGLVTVTSGSIFVADQVRLDFPKIEAEKIYITISQPTYLKADLEIKEDDISLNKIEDLKLQERTPILAEKNLVNIATILKNYIKSPLIRGYLTDTATKVRKINGYFYQFGIFHVTCGLSSYVENAIAVSSPVRAKAPRLFAIQANLDTDISFTDTTNSYGTVEFSVVKVNYDINNSLIKIQDFPVPNVEADGYITERLILSSDNTGQLRFPATAIERVVVLSTGRTLTVDDYLLTTVQEDIPTSYLKINRVDINKTSLVIVRYKPKYGTYLDESRLISLEDNTTRQLSLSNIDYVISTESRIANREVSYADIYVRIILRRNNSDSSTTPQLRDYQLLINENDPGRFLA